MKKYASFFMKRNSLLFLVTFLLKAITYQGTAPTKRMEKYMQTALDLLTTTAKEFTSLR